MDEALADSQRFDSLEGPDRGFARAIASSTLRGLGRIDRALSGFLDRPIKKIDKPGSGASTGRRRAALGHEVSRLRRRVCDSRCSPAMEASLARRRFD